VRAYTISVVDVEEFSMAEHKQRLRVSDDASVTETYANRVISTSFDGGSICVTLGTVRCVPAHTDESAADSEPSVHVTARLTLSPSAAVDLVKNVNELLAVARGGQRPPQVKHSH
jgi:hypothetical protein